MEHDDSSHEDRKTAGASKGGLVRAARLTPEERQQIARSGARARWLKQGVKPIRATHDGTLKIGDVEIPCANLPDGRRVLSERAVLSALGRGYSGYYSERDAAEPEAAAVLPRYLAPKVLRPFVSETLRDLLSRPVAYTAVKANTLAKGVPAEALPLICDVWIKARDAGVLTSRQRQTADKADLLKSALGVVGITALVDEATGYQYDRARTALADILEAFISKELARWAKTFSDDFYREMFRLRGWKVEDFKKRPGVVGKWTADIVYARLAPGVLDRLQAITPRDGRGRLKHHMHRWLTRDVGDPALREHLGSVTTIMKLAPDWGWFMETLDRLHPRYDTTLLLPFKGALRRA